MRNQKGITLIALVITIIVLLILAGVSIAMLSGDNGILSNASRAKVVNTLGALKDEANLLAAEAVSDYYEQIYVTGGNSTTGLYSNLALVKAIAGKLASMEGQNPTEVTIDVTDENAITDTSNTATITIASNADTNLKTIGTVESNGGISWEDHFTGEAAQN